MAKVIVNNIVNVDFDGTVCDFKYPEMGDPKKGVKESLQKMKDMGYTVRIFTCRTNHIVSKLPEDREKQIADIKKYLERHEIPFDDVLNIDKPLGFFIDDVAIGFRDDWGKALTEFETMTDY